MMNYILKSCLLLATIAFISLMGEGPAKADVFAVITSHTTTGGIKSLGSVAGKLAVSTLKRGDTLIIYDGTKRKVVAEITIPMDEHFQSKNFRKSYLRRKFRPVAKFIKSSKTAPSTVSDNNLIRLFREFAGNVRSSYPGQPVRILMFGSAFYHDNRQPGYSMRRGRYPNDAHFTVDGFTSPFGTADRAKALENTKVHFCNAGDKFQSSLHSEVVHRAWSLYLARLGGVLTTLTKDTNQCIRRFLADDKPARTFAFAPDPGRPTMIQLKPVKWKTGPDVKPVPLKGKDIIIEPSHKPLRHDQGQRFLGDNVQLNVARPLNTVGRAKIGIRWDCNCDLDLYVQHKDVAKPLFYNNKTSDIARFSKDWVNSPDNKNTYEFVEFFKSIDVLDIKIRINFYGGNSSSGAKGTVRLWLENNPGVWELPFHIPATKGNTGNEQENENSEYWVTIDRAKLLNLTHRSQEGSPR